LRGFFCVTTHEDMKTAPALLLPFCLLVSPPAPAQTTGNAEAAKGKISMCIGCHGIPMYKTVFPEVYSVPMIAGQTSEYIVKALQAYRAGERSHPSMQGIAKSLTDRDMADLAAYYGRPGKAGK
jgi:cytochrome c553